MNCYLLANVKIESAIINVNIYCEEDFLIIV